MVAAACASVALLLSMLAPAARASLGIQSSEFSIDSAPPAGAEPGAVGPPQVQAGSHPYQVTFTFAFDRTTNANGETVPSGAVKTIEVDLPPGFIGSLAGLPQCPVQAFMESSLFSQGCPADTQVGTMSLDSTFFDLTFPVFNLEPAPEVVGQLGVFALVAPVPVGISVRTGGDYGLTMSMRNLPQFLPVFGGSVKLWGVPADERHDSLRGSCLNLGEPTGRCPSGAARKPFLTLPGSCGEPPQARFRVDSWEQPGSFLSFAAVPRDDEGTPLGLLGCDRLGFGPAVETRAESRAADAPSGFSVDLRLPQSENPDGLGEADLRSAAVTLPRGVSVNLAAADGLGACLPGEIGLDDSSVPRCPDSSRIGSVEIETPLIADPLQGAVFLAAPQRNPFGGMLAAYVVAQRDGVLIKLAARIEADPSTGQLTIVFEGPQLPFSDLSLSFDGGPRAPLATTPWCGTFAAATRLTSYAAPDSAVAATPSRGFVIDRDCGGGFSPAFHAGATSSLAGQRTGLALQLARADGEQTIQGFTATLPQGLLPLLGTIPPCAEAQAAVGSCDASSQVGSIAIAAGAGSHPFPLSGKVFLTGPYGGAPFGLSIAVAGVAGPFDLGTVVARAKVSVDPRDMRVTIATDSLPQILQGIPLRIRSLDLSSEDRPGFFLEPTRCTEQRVTGMAQGGGGATASLSSPFLLGGCRGLPFSPRISASTSARVTRSGGAALELAVRNPGGGQGNLRAISVAFPRQLSPRLSAIQAACPRATFAADLAFCPRASIVGRAAVRSPVLDAVLRGPAYLVSRGGDALPQIVLALQARGIELRVVGSLRVSETGTTAAEFSSLPDAPISSFALSLPRGPRSALGASFLGGPGGSLCGRDLTMAARIVAQNGSSIRRSFGVSVRGCASPSAQR